MDDGHEVAGELFVWREYRVVENDETCPSSIDEPFDELDSEPCQSIFVGNHNICTQFRRDSTIHATQWTTEIVRVCTCDMSLFEVDQKPREPFPFVFET